MATDAKMGSILLELLTASNDISNRFLAPDINEIVSNENCAEMFDILVINALGHKCPIAESTIDLAMNFIIDKCHNEINTSDCDDHEKLRERQHCTLFYTQAGLNLKQHFDKWGLLHRC